jgi:gluconate 2-dehydrogenase gamma chain
MAQQQIHRWLVVNGLDRRTFLKASAGASALLVVDSAFALDALAQDEAQNNPLITGYQFFTTPQAETIIAMAERIWPAGDDGPGAIDAGVVYYIDHALAGEYVEHQLAYRAGIDALNARATAQHEAAFADLSADDQHALLESITAAEDATATDLAQAQEGAEDTPPSAEGVSAEPAPAMHQLPGAAAQPASPGLPTQVGVTERQVAGLTPPSAGDLPAFFALVHAHTMEGLFADPIYGGNRDFAGWRAVGYPGAYYVYTEEEQQSFEPLDKPFQSIADL